MYVLANGLYVKRLGFRWVIQYGFVKHKTSEYYKIFQQAFCLLALLVVVKCLLRRQHKETGLINIKTFLLENVRIFHL